MKFSDKILTNPTIVFNEVVELLLTIMDFFFLNEAIGEREDNFKLVFSDDSKEEYSEEEQLDSNNEDEMFVCNESNDEDGEQDASFYRSLNNKEERGKFPHQTRNPEVVQESDNECFEKMTCQSFLIQKIEMRLNVILLIVVLIRLKHLKKA